MLSFSGLEEKEIEVRKVLVDEETKTTITTFIVGDPSLPTLVLVHGYGGSGTLFYKVMKGLA